MEYSAGKPTKCDHILITIKYYICRELTLARDAI